MTSRDTAPKTIATPHKGVQLDLTFTDLLANGQGVGRWEGLVVFCFGPLPGELARVKIATVKPRYFVAELIEILRESPARVRPFCPVFGVCGGCQLQHLTYPAQLRWKREVVREAVQRIGGFSDAVVHETIGMNVPRAYRNKMSLVVDRSTDPAVLGFYRQRSHEVVAIDHCPIVTPKLDTDLRRIHALRSSAPVRNLLREARHLVARSTRAGNTSVLTITTARKDGSAPAAAKFLRREVTGLAGVTNSFDVSNENAILGRRQLLLDGRSEIQEMIGGIRYHISPGSFFQVNVEILERIFLYIAPWLARSLEIADLYCGVGAFALFFAKRGCSVWGVEANPSAIEEAKENALRNGLERLVRFTVDRVEKLAAAGRLGDVLRNRDVVFLDPPRKGCDEITLAVIAAQRVPAIWYLSCDPATLARDLKVLAGKGYRLGPVQPFDMFPQTGHVEALAVLEYEVS